jgi:flagellar biosynthesis protein FlhF
VTAAVDDIHAAEAQMEPSRESSPNVGIDWQEFVQTQHDHYRGLRRSIKMLDEKLADVEEQMGTLVERGHQLPQQNEVATVGHQPQETQYDHILSSVHAEWRQALVRDVLRSVKGREPAFADWIKGLSAKVPAIEGFDYTAETGTKAFVLAGPTGVGKTTTLAKLAAQCVLKRNLSVGLISIDTFRIAAVEQLREYASLLGVEMAVAFSARELARQMELFHEKDVIFVDTPGRSQFDSIGINEIRKNIETVDHATVALIVAASVREQDAMAVYDNYSVLNPEALVVTKTDEAACCDGLTRLLDESGLPVAYLTDGQRVPEDIHEASSSILASLILSCGANQEVSN